MQLWLGLLLATAALGDVVVEQVANPHARVEACAVDDELGYLLERPIVAPLDVQADTFDAKRVARTKRGTQVTVYDFRQPRRLSEAELPFSIVPVRDAPELLASATTEADLWFPGYKWQVVGAQSCGRLVHVGWRYSSDEGETFLALIVRADERLEVGLAASAAVAALLSLSASRAH